ncbi:hypothetical protein LOK49_LG10G00760 [Camellia lanceoleosa]|uniref:Uncharacterized protein n=1 Tax=Camellia lanceoleosa TaxID=1840588 RepID=A0ACC0G801_9ERIC|nr:hypothetical protein LOK49_LG10G00760 [Camellia lanceoleosa]
MGKINGTTWSSKKLICNAAAGARTGAIATTFVCPLDVIKTRLQVHGFPEAHHSGPKVNNSAQLTFGANMIAASGAGAVTAIAANPPWVAKTRLQNSVVVINFAGECSPVGYTDVIIIIRKQAMNSIPLLVQTKIEFWNCFAAIESAQPTMGISDVGVRLLDLPKFSTLEGFWTVWNEVLSSPEE